MGRSSLSLSSLLLLLMILLLVLHMHKKTAFWTWKDGKDSRALPTGRKSYSLWLIKPNCTLIGAPKCKFGYEVPHNFNHAAEIDAKCGNTKCQDAMKLDRQSQDEYKTFEDWGFKADPPKDYKKIWVHLVFDVKHDC